MKKKIEILNKHSDEIKVQLMELQKKNESVERKEIQIQVNLNYIRN